VEPWPTPRPYPFHETNSLYLLRLTFTADDIGLTYRLLSVFVSISSASPIPHLISNSASAGFPSNATRIFDDGDNRILVLRYADVWIWATAGILKLVGCKDTIPGQPYKAELLDALAEGNANVKATTETINLLTRWRLAPNCD
jgi:hypothetical protein